MVLVVRILSRRCPIGLRETGQVGIDGNIRPEEPETYVIISVSFGMFQFILLPAGSQQEKS